MVILCIQSLSLISDGSRSDVKVNVPISGGSGSSSLIDELSRISKLNFQLVLFGLSGSGVLSGLEYIH